MIWPASWRPRPPSCDASSRRSSAELRQDRDQLRLDGRKIQGRLDHADSRLTTVANQLQSELDAIRRLSEQLGARQLPGPRSGE